MSKAPRPDVTASTERLQVMASYARIRLAFGAPLLVALSGVKSTAFRVLLPLLHVSMSSTTLYSTPEATVDIAMCEKVASVTGANVMCVVPSGLRRYDRLDACCPQRSSYRCVHNVQCSLFLCRQLA